KEDILYCCQYNESNFEFFNRLAVEYGEWFYYDGRNLFFGKPSSSESIKLVYGEHLESINFSLKLAPNKANAYSYHAENDEVFTTSPGTIKGDTYVNKSIEVSDKLYRTTLTHTVAVPVSSQSDMDLYAKNRQGQKAAATVQLSAFGDNPKVKIGNQVELILKETDLSGQDSTEEARFLVTSITHTLNGTGTYSHEFTAISASAEHIPAELKPVHAENQVAIVKENKDPLGFGRVKVQMPWQKADNETTDWIRILTPDAGSSSDVSKNRGFVFVPEIDDQVILGFEHNHPSRPFVLGSVFHGKNGAGGGKENNVKTIKTRSGHTISLDDTKDAETIIISDKSGNEIKYDTKKKSLHITSTEDIELTAKNIKITAEENVEIMAKKKISLTSEGDMELISEKELALQSEKDTTVKSGAGITLEATKDAILNGQNVTAEGKVKATFTGAQTKISGKMTALQGASGKIEIT
ncbi:MAG: hypothetical protein H7329_07205, partial [Opitutaceae bacterium]|nr:hypothetical protein [Cytophagales bacterium]